MLFVDSCSHNIHQSDHRHSVAESLHSIFHDTANKISHFLQQKKYINVRPSFIYPEKNLRFNVLKCKLSGSNTDTELIDRCCIPVFYAARCTAVLLLFSSLTMSWWYRGRPFLSSPAICTILQLSVFPREWFNCTFIRFGQLWHSNVKTPTLDS